jgi:hypothetical protein
VSSGRIITEKPLREEAAESVVRHANGKLDLTGSRRIRPIDEAMNVSESILW